MKHITVLFLFSFLLYCCDPADNRMKFVNNSKTDVYFYYTCDSSLYDFNIFRAGYYKAYEEDSTYLEPNQLIKKGSFKNIPFKGSWTHYVNSCSKGEIHFYIYLDSVVNKYTDNEIKRERMYEKHYVFALKDLKKDNWTITYP